MLGCCTQQFEDSLNWFLGWWFKLIGFKVSLLILLRSQQKWRRVITSLCHYCSAYYTKSLIILWNQVNKFKKNQFIIKIHYRNLICEFLNEWIHIWNNHTNSYMKWSLEFISIWIHVYEFICIDSEFVCKIHRYMNSLIHLCESKSVHMNSYMNSYSYEFIYEIRIYTYKFIHMNSYTHEFIRSFHIWIHSYDHFIYEFISTIKSYDHFIYEFIYEFL